MPLTRRNVLSALVGGTVAAAFPLPALAALVPNADVDEFRTVKMPWSSYSGNPSQVMTRIWMYGRPGMKGGDVRSTLNFAERAIARYNAHLGPRGGDRWAGIPDYNGPLDEITIRFIYDNQTT